MRLVGESLSSGSAPECVTGHILLVEDSPTQAVFTRAALEAAGHTVEVARNGRAGLAAAQGSRFDLVVTDVRMPLMDGFELCKALKKEFAGALPVILLTSVTDTQDVARTLEAGADNFVGKPFEVPVLLERIGRTLHRAKSLRTRPPSTTDPSGGPAALRSAEQMAELLSSTTQDALAANLRLRERDAELAGANATLDEHARTLEARVAAATGALSERDAQLRLVIGSLPIAVVTTDRAGVITFAEGISLATLHPEAATPQGRAFSELLVDHPQALAALHRGLSGREAMARVEAAGRVLELRIAPSTVAERTTGLACALIDITEHERTTAALDRLALTDSLTGLPNRSLLRDRLGLALRAADRTDGPVTVLFLDLDRFKQVNDLHGHEAGDELLRQVTTRVAATLRGSDTLGRLGGDEFAIVLPGADLARGGDVAGRVASALIRPFTIDGIELIASASIGIAGAPEHGRDADTLLRCADVAMFSAKRAASGQRTYDVRLDKAAQGRAAFAEDLARALAGATDEFTLEYQPVIAIGTDDLCGVEALARWHHPVRGPVPPVEFLALAAASGQTALLTDRVIDLAVGQCAAWRDAGLRLPVSVNLSARDLSDEGLGPRITALLASRDLTPADLTFEISERVVSGDPGRTRPFLQRLTAQGYTLVIDDYGGADGSLLEFEGLPVRTVKLDRSIVRGMNTERGASPTARATIDLARALGYDAIAKGVEDPQALAVLRQLGCDNVQGHHLARPMAAADLLPWVRSRSARGSGAIVADPPSPDTSGG